MELRLYHHLKRELLGGLAAASERHDPAYQKAVEAYAAEAETGIRKWAREAIADWLNHYNRLMSRPVRLRYYQILALYFTEQVLREERAAGVGLNGVQRNKLAYWMATGSGKTLLMHLNILQYIAHIGGMQAFDELQVILTTPGVNLIDQHRRELTPLIDALNRQCANRIKLTVESTGSLLNHERGYFNLPPSSRVFRLVLVDEGHIGLAGGGKEAGAFKQLRHNLADFPNAFLFEYSATYHGINDKYVDEYGDQIVYDYNYYRFFKDGYGKDYSLQKVAADDIDRGQEAWANFQTAFLTLADKLAVHDELRLKDDGLGFVNSFADKPLIAFMGNTVEDKKKEGKGQDDEVSDIRKLLAYLAKLTPEQRRQLAPVFNGDATDNLMGPLTLTRCAAVTDEIYLSWGDGAYWGIVNVGNGDKFFNDSENHPELLDAHKKPLTQLRKAVIVERRFQFSDIDLPGSTINVLVGSRKFAEGWNCYRVSVIGLINLGSSKGNKIIQIFGRGVRLRGLKGDGKRRAIAHLADYDALVGEDTAENRLRRLETLNVFSLKASYLETFLKGLEQELPRWIVERRVVVEAQSLKLGKAVESFEQYSKKLPIFKVGRDDSEPRLLATLSFKDGKPAWHWAYFHTDGEESGELARLNLRMDYRPDVADEAVNLAEELRQAVKQGMDGFLPLADWRRRLDAHLQARKMQWRVEDGGTVRPLALGDLLGLVNEVLYSRPWAQLGFALREQLLAQTLSDAVAQLHGKLIYDLNKRRYRFGEPLRQSADGEPGDFISHYDLRIEFEKEADKAKFEAAYPSPGLPTQLPLTFQEPRHLYAPLLKNAEDKEVKQGFTFKALSISPDALNPGERKFVQDLHVFLGSPVNQGRLRKFDFYLMRNVESLRSVGVYLDSETRAYYPDFVLWAVSDKKTHVLLVDPKGQSGIQNWESLKDPYNAKVALATSPDLVELAKRLASISGKAAKVDSFIVLRKTSPLGRAKGAHYDLAQVEDMQRRHVMHLDWAPADEHGRRFDEEGDAVSDPPDQQCYVERMFACAGLL
ncbi:MAG: DEAD/DEAH box helicase family protein [Pseudomonadota bacterium]|nr:DEAD/DEAH box helicase family protein [Pseudomonadota bacterium]